MINDIINQHTVTLRVRELLSQVEHREIEGQVEELGKEVDKLRDTAKRARDEALDGLSPQGLHTALTKYEIAIEVCKHYRLAARKADKLELEKAVAKRLYQCLGSSGGTFRDGKWFDEAIERYDEGYSIESDRRYGFIDTYNRLQRLVVRVIKHPDCAEKEDTQIGSGLNVPKELSDLYSDLERQFKESDRPDEDKVWAMADLSLLRILRGEPASQAWREFASRNRSQNAYEANHRVFLAFARAGLTTPGVIESIRFLAVKLEDLYDYPAEIWEATEPAK